MASYEKLITNCLNILSISPNEVSIIYSLANAYYHLGNYESAKVNFEKLVFLYSDTLQAKLAKLQLKKIKEYKEKEKKKKKLLEDKVMPKDVEDAIVVIKQSSSQQKYIKEWLTSYEKVDKENQIEKKEYICSNCNKELTGVEVFFLHSNIVCIECINKKLEDEISAASETERKRLQITKIPIIRGILSGIIVGSIYAFIATLLNQSGWRIIEITLGITLNGKSFLITLCLCLLIFCVICAVIGSLLEYYEQINYTLVGCFLSMIIGESIILLYMIYIGKINLRHIFDYSLVYSALVFLIIGFFIITIDKFLLMPYEERRWRIK